MTLRAALLLLAGSLILYGQEARALELKARGDAAGALAAWEKAAEANPKSARIQDEIGFLLAVLNKPADAVRHFTRALELDVRYAPAHYHLGVAYWLRRDAG